MEKVLVNEFESFQFRNQVLLVQQSAFIQGKGCINSIIGYRPVNNIIIVREMAVGAGFS